MSPAVSSHFKIGIFVILSIAALIITAVALGLTRRRPTVVYHSYFEESVQGLDKGSPVKYRGVGIGSVASIAIAPDHKLVDVGMAIDRDLARYLDFARMAPKLRAELGIQGITGVKYIDIDIAGPNAPSPPKLSFRPAARYIPSRKSLLGSLESNLETLAEELPKLVERTNETLSNIDAMIDEMREKGFVDQLVGAVEDTRHLIRNVDRTTVPRLNRAAEAVRNFGRSATRSADDLDQTVRDVGAAARSLRTLADDIDREPDLLIKGRARTSRR